MNPLAFIELASGIIKLVNNILEAQPVEQRKASALIAWEASKPVLELLFPDIMSKLTPKINATIGLPPPK